MKSGGHTSNPEFSSTNGIHIYLGKFSQVTYDPESGTAVIGSGLVWDTVYERLQEHGVTVIGARAPGVSERRDSIGRSILNLLRNRLASAVSCSAEVGSWRLSTALHTDGSSIGYSYKSNQHGLAIDTIVGFNLVLPDGTVTYVTEKTHPDLFFGLKGGYNNFVSHSSNVLSIRPTSPHSRGS